MERINGSSSGDISEVWSGNLGCIQERLGKFIGNPFLADMVFLVGKDRVRVPGHKFILNTCSWEFYNVFNLLKLDKDELPVEDVTCSSFRDFLAYCYTGKVELNEVNALEIHKLAQRFHMMHLVDLCETKIGENVTKKTCMMLYSKSMALSQGSALKERILHTIEDNFSYLVQDHGIMKTFVDLPLAAVREIVAMEHLQCDEMELFDALMKWATNMCRKLKIPEVPKNLRTILCDVFCMIRFPIMKIEWFLEILAKYPEILTPSEIALISLTIRGDVKSCSKFNYYPRKNIIPMLRNAMKLDISEGTLVPCFLNTMQEMNVAAQELVTKFRSAKPEVLLGFAFVARKGQEVNLLSCRINQDLSCTEVFEKKSIISKRYKLGWDYDLIVVRLGRKLNVMQRNSTWYELKCTFDKSVVQIASESNLGFGNAFKFGADTGEVNINGLFVCKSPSAIVPYLIFE